MLFHRNDARTEAVVLSTVQPGGAVGLVPPGSRRSRKTKCELIQRKATYKRKSGSDYCNRSDSRH